MESQSQPVPPSGSGAGASSPTYAVAGSAYPAPGPNGPTVVPVVQKIIFEHPRRSRWLFWLMALALVFSVLYSINLQQRYQNYFKTSGTLTEKFHSLEPRAENKIAIIRVEETIYSTDGYIKKQIDQVRDDLNVKGVVLRIDSPGGTMVASDYLYHRLRQLTDPTDRKLPLVVSMGGLCASGGYYLAMAVGDTENTIYAEPTTWCGSIGVVIPHYNAAGLLEEWKIEDDTIQSSPLKTIGSFTKPMTEQEREILQKLVDDGFARFKSVVAAGRPKLAAEPSKLDAVATGQVFTTTDAIANGLVDQEGFLEVAIDRAIELAGLTRKEVRVVQFESPRDVLDSLLSVQSAGGRTELERLAELATPRAYYLWTMLPGWEAALRRE